uniref:Flavin-containing monooxygenase n=1 Tax=Chenopodium quinoa TaxID=63459 RepID=A0A803MWS4_CHEQI
MADSTVIVVGAGPSGLATAACLTHHSIPYILLEREDCFASLWKKKAYDRLHLHLPKEYCELPHMNMPSNYPKYVPKKDFLQYLDNYVDHFGIKPLYKRYLVVASGETCDPYCPEIEGLSSFQGKVVHSTQYKSGKEYEDKSVLVIGAGNSGIEIGLDLANYGAKTSIVVRSPVHILSKGMVSMGLVLLKHLPLKWVDNLLVLVSKIVYGDVTKYGLTRPQEGPFYLKVAFGKYPIIDQGSLQKIKSGEIQILPAIRSIRGNDVLFKDGRSYAFDSIIFATGFKRATNQWLKQSFPNNWKGKNGLYCAGLARRGLYGAAMDAENISNDIKKRN